MRAAVLAVLLLPLAGCTGRLDRFEATLAAQDSATQGLRTWCAARRIADPPQIRAIQDRVERAPVTDAVRAALGVGPDEPLGYRHVRLACGETVLSVAQNWYVPARLTPAMNATLETTQAPFGTVVAPLRFRRERLATRRGAATECPGDTVLSHKAVLRLADGRAISLVVECYTPATLHRPAAR